MAGIDITTMRGEIPRDADGLLPQSNSTYAENCHFDCGVITPLTADIDASIAFTFTPQAVFHYYDDYWFAWDHDVDVIRSPIAQDPYNRIYYTDGEYPKLTSADIALVGDNLPSAYYRLGVPAPETAIGISAVTPPNDDDGNPVIDDDPTNDETRYYCETYVTAYGEEGPPGPASADVEITAPGSSVTLSLAAPPAGNYNITRRRIYRTVTTTSDAEFLEVVELDIAVTSYVDSLASDELTATLETEDYLMPPDNMIGLCAMNNGISVGFASNEIMFSIPYLPYAWPDAYKLSTYDNIVAIASVDTAVVAGTEGVPVVFSGITPGNISDKPVQLNQACLSKRSMVSMLGFVLYAGPAGIVKVTATGAGSVATANVMTREQWQAFNPTTVRAWSVGGNYIGLYDYDGDGDGVYDSVRGFIYDPNNNDLRRLTNTFDAAYADPQSDLLYVAKGDELWVSQASQTPLSMRWRSKVFHVPQGSSYSVCRVMSPSVIQVGIRFFIEGQLACTMPPGSIVDNIFRLPVMAGSKWQAEVYGYAQVDRITLAQSVKELPA
ncbi:hypothetical protein ABQ428_07115 [Citrobacter freundii]|uniref:hypothetical protein n=1 Tax=Citrobacter freundii TaxID=546 RepID=UPI0010A49A3F|nr:hypothetical protein [Citrobacter freundii]DAO91298.1 MAG TPA: hypothetical protein [Caudoviricetes sp.]ELJ2673354.1 hypothetical protein [Citrobacter freundii]THE47760.1 hypothetical protein DJ485_22840 [Citrobacter freundii]HCW3136740.1 hypothetical protein [Citrobacter freundii]HCW3406520.1 hypothetical protein [Citrobacter freundii]